ncbi:MAG: hypothetical protein KatS3mg108_2448 [Isosphaeraceae bacterium]|jgi:dihydrofolate reductase|nr:MAG: hypothetical protein KatS3mg108_2448 [Isosphaeraceae bacterium]
MAMVEVVYSVAASLDGYIATPDGKVDWLTPFQRPDQDYGHTAFLSGIDGLIMGRRTYDQVRGFGDWAYPGKPCRVVTTRALSDTPPEVSPAASPAESLAGLSGRVWLVGGTELAEAFRAGGLIDEYAVTLIPVVLGDGVPLFRPGRGVPLRLLECRHYPDGVVQVRYAVSCAEPGAAADGGGM